MSVARKNLNWEEQAKLALDPEKVRSLHKKNTASGDTCTMCGGMCAMKLVSEYLGKSAEKC
jgi:phosphomethylpyrimidine synthase